MCGGNVKIVAIIEIHEVSVSIYFVPEEHIFLPPSVYWYSILLSFRFCN
jgi:hypothetical protein